MTGAILFVPPDAHAWLSACIQYCARHGYEVLAVASTWADASTLVRERRAVLVAARRDHLPPERLPRLEVVVEEGLIGQAEVPASRQRPRRQRPEAH